MSEAEVRERVARSMAAFRCGADCDTIFCGGRAECMAEEPTAPKLNRREKCAFVRACDGAYKCLGRRARYSSATVAARSQPTTVRATTTAMNATETSTSKER